MNINYIDKCKTVVNSLTIEQVVNTIIDNFDPEYPTKSILNNLERCQLKHLIKEKINQLTNK